MKTLLLLFALLPNFGLAADNGRLACDFSNGYFRVFDGQTKFEKYVTSANSEDVLLECGNKAAAAIIGSYLVFFENGRFHEKYVTSSSLSERSLAVRGEMAIAVIGSYFIVADKAQIQEKYVSSTDNVMLAMGNSIGAALMGSYFVAYVNGRFIEKYVGSRSADDMIRGRGRLIAASCGSYFVVLDGVRKSVAESYVGNSGSISINQDNAIHMSTSGRQPIYSLVTGTFR